MALTDTGGRVIEFATLDDGGWVNRALPLAELFRRYFNGYDGADGVVMFAGVVRDTSAALSPGNVAGWTMAALGLGKDEMSNAVLHRLKGYACAVYALRGWYEVVVPLSGMALDAAAYRAACRELAALLGAGGESRDEDCDGIVCCPYNYPMMEGAIKPDLHVNIKAGLRLWQPGGAAALVPTAEPGASADCHPPMNAHTADGGGGWGEVLSAYRAAFGDVSSMGAKMLRATVADHSPQAVIDAIRRTAEAAKGRPVRNPVPLIKGEIR